MTKTYSTTLKNILQKTIISDKSNTQKDNQNFTNAVRNLLSDGKFYETVSCTHTNNSEDFTILDNLQLLSNLKKFVNNEKDVQIDGQWYSFGSLTIRQQNTILNVPVIGTMYDAE